jgi:hypothetical protein
MVAKFHFSLQKIHFVVMFHMHRCCKLSDCGWGGGMTRAPVSCPPPRPRTCRTYALGKRLWLASTISIATKTGRNLVDLSFLLLEGQNEKGEELSSFIPQLPPSKKYTRRAPVGRAYQSQEVIRCEQARLVYSPTSVGLPCQG